jgi:tetratricopeptide (TPR) repeat protein
MRIRLAVALVGFLVGGLLFTSAARAEGEGQAELDRAIEAKLAANTYQELGNVVDLCEEALKKGLDEGNTDFCKQMLASTLLQRAEGITNPFFEGQQVGQAAQRFRLATKDLSRAIEVDPDQPAAHLLMGKLHMLPGGDRKRAREALDAAVDLAKEEPALRAEALRWRAETQEKPADRLKDLNEAIELAGDDVKLHRERGAILLGLGKAEEALADFDQALTVDPEDAATHEARGMALETLKRWDDARAAFTRASELAPESATALLRRARTNALAGDNAAAAEDAGEALKIDPSNLFGLLLRAQSLAQIDKADEGLPDAQRALDLHPESDDAVRVWAMLIEKCGKTNQTIKRLQKQVEKDPSDALPPLEIGLLYAGQHRLGKAIEAYTVALAADSSRPFVHQARADTYLNLGMQKEAVADYKAALKLDPNNSGILNNLAWVLATSPDDSLRDGPRAIQLALKGCELTEYRQAHIISTLAAAYAETGDFETARRWSEKSVELGDDSLKDQLRKELASYQAEKPWREKQGEPAEPPANGAKPSDSARNGSQP